MQAARNKDAREAKNNSIAQHKEEAVRLETEHAKAEAGLDELQAQQEMLRSTREELQQEAARVTAELAGLEERRRGAEASFQRIDRLNSDLERRVQQLNQARAEAAAEREQRLSENSSLAQRKRIWQRRGAPRSGAGPVNREPGPLLCANSWPRSKPNSRPDASRSINLREDRAACSSAAAKLKSDLEHLEGSCLTEVNAEAAVLRADETIERLLDEALALEEETCRTLRERLEQIGPVNMMALDEYKETAERHGFLEVQRTDLIESIDNTMETIKEIDQISRTKFDEAFARINENFAQVFSRLFQGGQAFLRLTDAENQAESGLDIVASPPGKKLQNVLAALGRRKGAHGAGTAWSASSSSSPAPSAFSTKSMLLSTKRTWVALADLLRTR
jgi:chromosome segregation protein